MVFITTQLTLEKTQIDNIGGGGVLTMITE
jgi:hypothetical protein